MIQIFQLPGSDTLRFVQDGGDGGIYQLAEGQLELTEVDEIGREWVELTPDVKP